MHTFPLFFPKVKGIRRNDKISQKKKILIAQPINKTTQKH